jgi:hypothetical protein
MYSDLNLAALGGAYVKGRGTLVSEVEFAGAGLHMKLNGTFDDRRRLTYANLVGRNANQCSTPKSAPTSRFRKCT